MQETPVEDVKVEEVLESVRGKRQKQWKRDDQVDTSTTAPLSNVVEKEEGVTEEEFVEEPEVDVSQLKLTDDPLCNSEDLRSLMLENIDGNLNSSKRLIQLAAEAQFGGRFDVICANGDFR